MSDRKEYLKKYRLEHKEKYREYQRKYRGTHLSTYEKLQQENQELKKQLHEASIEMQEMIEQDIECPSNCSKLKEILNQQKEFIDYLEDLIKQNETVVEVLKYKLPKNCSKLLIDFYKEILQKYKEIIGDVENENK